MMRGLLMELEDHSCWTIAETGGHRAPHRLQHLLSRAAWDDQQVVDIASAWAAGHLDDGDAVLIVDETADEKSSADAGAHLCDLGQTVGVVHVVRAADDKGAQRPELRLDRLAHEARGEPSTAAG
jgi:SRSO17 transposase